MATKKKLLQAAAGNAGGAALDVDEVFSTYLYTGTGSTLNIVNNIDLAGEGGLVWHKYRGGTSDYGLFDTERGVSRKLGSNNTDAQTAAFSGYGITAFNSNGYTLGTQYSGENGNGNEVVSWTFRKAPKFFDVVTWTGTGSTQTIAHNLGSVPGMVMVKRTDASTIWPVYHTGVNGGTNPENYILDINGTASQIDNNKYWNDTAPTDSVFTVGTKTNVNASGGTYVAYLFAHNDGDGEFGPDADQDIVKCGSYTGNGSSNGPEIDLGFEPQWLLVKRSDAADAWILYDSMRGVVTGGDDAFLMPQSSAAENVISRISLTPTGFSIDSSNSDTNASGGTYIYIAIRRGPLAPPESATEVFAISQQLNTSGSTPSYNSGFPVDMAINKYTTGTDAGLSDRLRGAKDLQPAYTFAEYANSVKTFDYMDGYYNAGAGANSNNYSWMWKRAPNYMDCVAYSGTGTSNQTLKHNLGVVPEMMWVKRRNGGSSWLIYHNGIDVNGDGRPETDTIDFTDSAAFDYQNAWFDTAPTDTEFTVGSYNNVTNNGNTFIAYLFATLAGISKVGSVTHSGTTNVDCGFSSGARFVLLKRTDATGDWYIWDSERGIVSGNDPYLLLNSTAAQVTNTDYIDPLSSGFTITSNFTAGDYIFYAIA